MSIYCVAYSWGDGFITHEDREKGVIRGYPAKVWIAEDHMGQWVAKVNGDRKSKSEAQTLVTAEVDAAKTAWDNDNVESESSAEKIARLGAKPVDLTLP